MAPVRVTRAIPLAVMAAIITAGTIMALREEGELHPPAYRPEVIDLPSVQFDHPPGEIISTGALSRDDLAMQAALSSRQDPYTVHWCTSAARDVCR